tara:strand:+ start:5371 stop:6114 length:744 start_codon:yes stop_codon:yes gene_type:complete
MKIGLIGNTSLTKKAIKKILDMGLSVKYVFGLPKDKIESKANAIDLTDICKTNNIIIDDSGNWENINSQDLDLLISMGDSRIIPKIVLENNKVIGNHGAALPSVQGAATLVWARMLDLGYWGVSIFELEEKVDAGDILKIATFTYDNDCSMIEFVDKADDTTIDCLEQVLLNNFSKTKNKKYDIRVSKHVDSEKSLQIFKRALEMGMNIYMPSRNPKDSYIEQSWSLPFKKVFKIANDKPYPKWKEK